MLRHSISIGGLAVALGLLSAQSTAATSHSPPFLNGIATAPVIDTTTIPPNGDLNPYGVAIVPRGFGGTGPLRPGDILVSNFNDAANFQGTGTTIVAITPGSGTSTFFTAPSSLGPVGLTAALVALRSGLVVVGNTPTTDGTPATLGAGSLLFLDQSGRVVLDLIDTALIRGPWAMTADEADPDDPILYVSNVLTGTVTRIEMHVSTGTGGEPVPEIKALIQVASGFAHRTDPAALVIGPTGLLVSRDRRDLYVADTGNNRLQFVRYAGEARTDRGPGHTVFSGAPLRGPLGLAWAPGDTILITNGDAVGPTTTPANLVVEVEPLTHSVIATRQLDPGPAGGVFGVFIGEVLGKTSLLYVDDNSVTLNVLPRR